MPDVVSENIAVAKKGKGPRGPFSYVVAVVVLVCVSAYVAYDYLVVTEREKIESTIEDLRQAILSKNVEKIRALVMPDCRLHEGTIADWKDDTIRMGLLYGNPESIRVTNLELQVLQTLAKGSLLAEVTRYRRRGGPKGYRAPVSLEFRLVGSQWKVSAAIVRPVDIEEW